MARGVEDPLSEIAKTEAFRHVVVALGFGYDKASRKRIRRVDTNLGRNRTGVLNLIVSTRRIGTAPMPDARSCSG